jgi:hypothetical protein
MIKFVSDFSPISTTNKTDRHQEKNEILPIDPSLPGYLPKLIFKLFHITTNVLQVPEMYI